VILSLESHCSLKQQQAMTHYMKTILKDKLHLVEAEENKTFLPSPETLRKKIIVKVGATCSHHMALHVPTQHWPIIELFA